MSTRVHTIAYKQVDDLVINLDVHCSASATPTDEPHPLILWFHPGCLLVGDRTSYLPTWLIDELVIKQNWTFISADYRLLPEVTLLDILNDIHDLELFINNKLNNYLNKILLPLINLNNIIVIGASAGGYLALTCGWMYQTIRPRAVLSFYGMSLASESWYNVPQPHAQPLSHRLPKDVRLRRRCRYTYHKGRADYWILYRLVTAANGAISLYD